MTSIQKGDGVVLFNGDRGIVLGEPFIMNSETAYPAVPVHFDEWEGSIQLEAITEVWRDGFRVDGIKQLGLWG